MRPSADRPTMTLLRRFSAMSLALGATVWVAAEDLPAQPPSSRSSAPAFNGGEELDELWVGGWFSHNVLRVDWQTGESLGMFVPSGDGGLFEAHACSFGTDNNLYVTSHGNSTVRRYDGETGAFIDVFVSSGNGLNRSHSVFWNVDNTLLVSSEIGDRVNQYEAVTGNFLGSFVQPGEAGLNGPEEIIQGPDGMLYLSAQSNQVLRIDPIKGGVVDVFVGDDPDTPEDETGGLAWAHQLKFGPDGNLYVASSQTNQILRYDGETGAFLDVFVHSGGQGPQFPVGLAFGPDGHLYVGSFGNDRILCYDGITGEPLGVAANLGAMGLDGPLFIEFFTGPKCKSDLSEDGVVSAADLLILLGAWGPNAGHPADFDVNGLVGANDLLRLLASWGACP